MRKWLSLVAFTFYGIASLSSVSALAVDGKLLERRDSAYNTIYVYERDGYVMMAFGHNNKFWTETVYNPKEELALPVSYTRFMTASLPYSKDHSKILEIGFGGGRTAWYLHKYLSGTAITSVELDPEVVNVAKKYFGIREEDNFSIIVRDGRLLMMRNKERYNIIMVDAYRGPFVPFHLLTKEFYLTAKERLAPGGALVQNIEPSTMLFDAAVATIGSVFSNVDLYPSGGNIVVVAYDGDYLTQDELMSRARAMQERYKFRYGLPEMITQRRVLTGKPDAAVLTDDFAPVEALKAIDIYNRKLDNLAGAPK